MSESEDTGHYKGALLEEMYDMLQILLEGQEALVDVPVRLTNIEVRLDSVEYELKAIRAVLIDHSGLLNNQEGRITKLEQSRT